MLECSVGYVIRKYSTSCCYIIMVIYLGRSGVEIKVLRVDITTCGAEGLVNPANSLMRMGGGVAGALRRAAESEVEEEAIGYAPVPVGGAVAISAGRLQSKYIIHAPTMEMPAMPTTKERVFVATLATLRCAESAGVRSVAFPAMGAGVGGVPVEKSTRAMVRAIHQHLSGGTSSLRERLLVGLNDETVVAFQRALSDGQE